MIILTDKQKQAIPQIKWLINPFHHMGEGRTMALAVATLEVAIEVPNNTIYFREFIAPVLREHFIHQMKQIAIENYPNYYFWFNKMSLECMDKTKYLHKLDQAQKFAKYAGR